MTDYKSLYENSLKEIEELKEECGNRQADYDDKCKELEGLEDMEAQVTDALWDEATPDCRVDLVVADIHKLRKDNEKLKHTLKQQKFVIDEIFKQGKVLYDENEKLKKEKNIKFVIDELCEQKKVLYDENEKLEDILVSIQDELLGEVFEPSFDKLKEEIEKLKESIKRKDKQNALLVNNKKKLTQEKEAMVKTLPNDMDGYRFDTSRMRWVHYDEEEEEEEEEE